ncbi:hypothetical protein [Yersinia hibernica]|nr:hypothetical protein [Yersinia hibernica]
MKLRLANDWGGVKYALHPTSSSRFQLVFPAMAPASPAFAGSGGD